MPLSKARLRSPGMAWAVTATIQGRFGFGFDIKHDIGAKALDYRGLYKSAGA